MTTWIEKTLWGDGVSIILENVSSIEYKKALLGPNESYTFDNRGPDPFAGKPNIWNDAVVINGTIIIVGDENVASFCEAWEKFSGERIRRKDPFDQKIKWK